MHTKVIFGLIGLAAITIGGTIGTLFMMNKTLDKVNRISNDFLNS